MKKTIDEIRAELFCGKRIYDIPLRVTFYGRVSTEEDRQLNSLSHQASFFESKIKDCSKWEYVPGYIDEGITGTRADKRPQFMKMVRDAKAGLFDLILTKEVSRFARDIVDCVQTVRDLLKYEVGVLIEDINLNTMEKDAEFRLSIMAIVAQEESRKTSERVKFGYRQTMKQGKRHGATPPIGYLFREDNNGYWIDPGKQSLVEYVFMEYAKGEKGMRTLSRDLAAMGYLGNTGKPYNCSTLERMIRNPVYKGYIVNGKTYKPSYREDRKVERSREDWQLHYDPERVPPLVTDELWDAANRIMRERSSRMDGINCSSTDAYGNGRYAYSARILCADHDCAYHRAISRWNVDGAEHRREIWRCSMYKKYGRKECDAPILRKDDLDEIMRQMFSSLIPLLKESCIPLSKALHEVLDRQDRPDASDLEKEKSELEKKKKKLLDGWMNGILSDADYRSASGKISAQLSDLQQRMAECERAEKCSDNSVQQIKIMQQAFCNANLQSPQILDELVRRFVEKIVIRRAGSDKKNGQKPAYNMEIWLYETENPVFLDLSLSLRTQSLQPVCAI
ncbi:MAG: recombinase family protein [Oscillospiraceae bacterium]|nr:recombinase family protein [Oscillospiraceae bacterium]